MTPTPDLKMEEESRIHTRILRCALEVEESRAWWAHRDPSRSRPPTEQVFAEWWFGDRSFDRVDLLIQNMSARYDAFPPALRVLHAWRGMDRPTAVLVCHWALQLSDPLYRRFTGEFLPDRRDASLGNISRDQVTWWVAEAEPGRWSSSTHVQFASKLLSAAQAAGLVVGVRDPRPLSVPYVGDAALGWLLYLLRDVRISGTLLDNPYLRSVGLTGPTLDARLRAVPGLSLRRLGGVGEIEWRHESLWDWAQQIGALGEVAA